MDKQDVDQLQEIIASNMKKFANYPNYVKELAKDKEVNAYKFLVYYKEHIARNYNVFRTMNPAKGDRVLEIGPGACYLLWFLHRHGCNIDAIDNDNHNTELDGITYFGMFRKILGLEQYVRFDTIKKFSKIPCEGLYHTIVSVRTTFTNGWGKDACMFFLEDALSHLKTNGCIMASFIYSTNIFINLPLKSNVSMNSLNNLIIWRKK